MLLQESFCIDQHKFSDSCAAIEYRLRDYLIELTDRPGGDIGRRLPLVWFICGKLMARHFRIFAPVSALIRH
jgi:hypothetical protein